jgi:hypothetical protein
MGGGGILPWLRELPHVTRCFFQPHSETGFFADGHDPAVAALGADLLATLTPISNTMRDAYYPLSGAEWRGRSLRLRTYAGGAYAGTANVIVAERGRRYERVFVAIAEAPGTPDAKQYAELVGDLEAALHARLGTPAALFVAKRRRASFRRPFRFRCNGQVATDYINIAVDLIDELRLRREGRDERIDPAAAFGVERPAVIEVEWGGFPAQEGRQLAAQVRQALTARGIEWRAKTRRKLADLLPTAIGR